MLGIAIKMQQKGMSRDTRDHSKCFLLRTRFIFVQSSVHHMFSLFLTQLLFANNIRVLFLLILLAHFSHLCHFCVGTSFPPWSEVPKTQMVTFCASCLYSYSTDKQFSCFVYEIFQHALSSRGSSLKHLSQCCFRIVLQFLLINLSLV